MTTANIDNPMVNGYVPDRGDHADVLAEFAITVLASRSRPHTRVPHSRPPRKG